MGAWSRVRSRASVSQFLPHNSAILQLKVLMSMQMDAYLKKEQIGTIFIWVRALEGGFGGGASLRGVHPKKETCHPKKTPSCISENFFIPETAPLTSTISPFITPALTST